MSETIKIEGRAGGPLMTITYCITDLASGQWAMIDPTYEAAQTWRDRLIPEAQSPPAAVYITHAHFDHVAGLADLLRLYPQVPVWVHPEGVKMVESAEHSLATMANLPFEPSSTTHTYVHGDTVTLGQTQFKILEAPGHSPGSVMLLTGKHMIVGDVIFQGSVGRWDLPGADYETLSKSIREQVMTQPDDTIIYPGHGPATTVGAERANNYIVHQMLAGLPLD